ncbi:HNH endonuclease [Bordetella genomosp. 9]|uniref:HNH endonuclease n=1 Tax=Bordetella genomosp. 9 TaxID=1416803 RepID=UPI003B28688B
MCQCENCKGVKLVAHEVDHIIPVAKGGTDHPDNLRAMNRDCHAEKTKREANQGYRPKVAIGTDGWPSAN